MVEEARRQALQVAVGALCVEAGFLNSERDALGVLSEIIQSYITELGRTARVYSELASRTEPTLSDVQLALVDAGKSSPHSFQSSSVNDSANVASLPEYFKRPQRRHLPRQLKNYMQPQPRCLQVGTKLQRLPNIPSYLPPFPDPHTYIKTATFASPVNDYKLVRQKLATQKRNARKGLSKLLAKTRPSHAIFGEADPYGVFTVVLAPSPSSPLYLQALMPTPEDQADTIASRKLTNERDSSASNSQSDSQEGNSNDSGGDGAVTSLTPSEPYENPFLKPAKRIKLKPL